MDVRQYYRKIREVEAVLTEPYPLLVSLDTPDGGKAGLVSEVSRTLAARMIVEGCAVLASEAEQEQYWERQAEMKKSLEKAEMARRVQVAIITDSDLQSQTVKTECVDSLKKRK